MRIEKIKVSNYKVFQEMSSPKLGGLNVFTGNNGSGKSTFLDVMDFLKESMLNNVTQAVQKRGGLERLLSKKSAEEEFRIELYLTVKKETNSSYDQLIYSLSVGKEEGEIVVKRELLKQYSSLMDSSKILLDVQEGLGKVANKKDGMVETILFELEERNKLCIGIVGEVRGYPAVNLLRQLVTQWQLIDFNQEGFEEEQLALWTQQLKAQQVGNFEELLQKMKKAFPNLEDISTVEAVDGRIILQFQEGEFDSPITSAYIAQGQLKLWGLLLWLNQAHAAPLLGVESPENNLHSDLVEVLVNEFRAYAQKGGQLLVTSYSPSFLDVLRLEELFGITKKRGQSTLKAAKDDLIVQKGYEVGESLGRLWS